MRRFFRAPVSFSFLLVFVFSCSPLRAQKFLDPEFYLVDSISRPDLAPVDLRLMDSLLTLYHKATSDTVKARLVYDLIESCYNDAVWPKYNLYLKNFVEGELAEKGLDPKTTRFNERILSSCYNNIGYRHKQKGEIAAALENYRKAYLILKKINDHAGMAGNYNNVGYIYFDQGNIPLAIEYFHKSLQEYKLSNKADPNSISVQNQSAIVYNNLGLLYSRQNDYTRALHYYNQSLNIKLKTQEYSGLALAYGNIGSIYLKHHRELCQGKNDDCNQRYFVLGMQYLHKSIDYDKKINNEPSLARTYHNIASGFEAQGQQDSAVYYYNMSIKLKRGYKDIYGLCLSLSSLGELQLSKHDLKSAKKNLTEAYGYAIRLGFPESIAQSSEILSQIYERESDYKKAFDFYKTFIRMRDSTINEKNTRTAIERDTKFEYQKKQAADSVSNARKAEVKDAKILAQQSQLDSEHNKKMAMYTGIVSLLIVLFLIYTRFRSAQKQKNMIQEQKNLIEEKQRKIIDSIQYAQRLQNAILAKETEIKKVFPGFFLLYLPKDIVAGDFYFFERTATHAFYAAADCTGHGVPGAMISVICSNALSQSINEFKLVEPGEILGKARELILETFRKSGEHVKDGMDISLISLKLDRLNGSTVESNHQTFERLNPEQNNQSFNSIELSWAGANNSLLVYSAREGKLMEIGSDKQPVGYTENAKPFTTHTLSLEKNDYIFMYTDGYADQFGGPKGKKLKKNNLQKLLEEEAKKDPEEILQRLKLNFETWKGHHEQVDDVCIIGIRL